MLPQLLDGSRHFRHLLVHLTHRSLHLLLIMRAEYLLNLRGLLVQPRRVQVFDRLRGVLSAFRVAPGFLHPVRELLRFFMFSGLVQFLDSALRFTSVHFQMEPVQLFHEIAQFLSPPLLLGGASPPFEFRDLAA